MEQQMISKLNSRNAERQENYQNYLPEIHRKTPQNQQKSNTQREMFGSTQKEVTSLIQSINDFPRKLKNQFLSTKLSENLRSSLQLNKESFDMPNSKHSLGNAALKQINSMESSINKVLKVMKPQNVNQTDSLYKSESPTSVRKRSDSTKSQKIQSPTIQGLANQGPSKTERQKSNLNVQLKFDKVNPFAAECSPRNRKSFLSNISQKIILDVPQSINSQNNPKTPYNQEKNRLSVQQRDLFKLELREAMTMETNNFQQNEYQIFNEIVKKDLTSKYLTKSQNIINIPQNIGEENKRNKRETSERIFNNSYIISCGCYTKAGRSQGINKQNQDRFLVLPQFQEHFSIFAVSDGHGIFGHEVSQFITDNLPKILANDNNLLWRPLKSFSTLNDTLSKKLNNSKILINKSGATLILVGIKQEQKSVQLYSCNVGDSRAILLKQTQKGDWGYEQLSIDHKPSNHEEQSRILKCGGIVAPQTDRMGNEYGPDRIWCKNENWPGLSTSRALGDTEAKAVGVIHDPTTLNITLKPQDKVIIIGSDGLFEFLTNDDIKYFVKQWVTKDVLDANLIAKDLVKKARGRWKQVSHKQIDDISCVVVVMDIPEYD